MLFDFLHVVSPKDTSFLLFMALALTIASNAHANFYGFAFSLQVQAKVSIICSLVE